MDYILGSILSYLLLYKYLALFILIFGAALVLPVPSNIIMIVVGVFCDQGYMGFWPLMLVALVANVTGDSAGYLLTRYYGESFWRKLVRKQPAYLIALERYMKDYANLTIVVTRFVNTIGFAVNLFCGLIKLPFKRFIILDILGNVLSISLMMTVGFIFGKYWSEATDFVNLFSVGLTIILVVFAGIKITSHYLPKQSVKTAK